MNLSTLFYRLDLDHGQILLEEYGYTIYSNPDPDPDPDQKKCLTQQEFAWNSIITMVEFHDTWFIMQSLERWIHTN